jgi:CDP-diacylglycerol---glycerol-3-phosphate 3-phosphatidyltransferase
MFTDFLRRTFRPLLDSIARVLSRLGVTPNMLTVFGFVITLGVSVVLGFGYLRVGGLLILVASALDSFDGALARLTNRVTAFGGFLDSTLDRYSEAALYAALAWYFTGAGQRLEVVLAVAALFGSLAVSYTRARAEGLGIQCKVGIFTRVERLLALSIGLALGLPTLTLWVVTIFSHVTAIQRIVYVRRHAK